MNREARKHAPIGRLSDGYVITQSSVTDLTFSIYPKRNPDQRHDTGGLICEECITQCNDSVSKE